MPKKTKPVAKATKAVAKPKATKAVVKTGAKVTKPKVAKPVTKVAPKVVAKPVVQQPVPSPKELVKEKVAELVKKDAVEKTKVTETVAPKSVSNTISFEEIKKSLTRPMPVKNKFF